MDPEITYDLLVLGGGPAGYAAAIRAGQLGKSGGYRDGAGWRNMSQLGVHSF